MKEKIILAGGSEKENQRLRSLLEKHQYKVTTTNLLSELKQLLSRIDCRVVMVDLDETPAEKNFFGHLKHENPSLYIMGLSSRTFHPELKEAISNHIFACLRKPVDSDELLYLLKTICENDANTHDSPKLSNFDGV